MSETSTSTVIAASTPSTASAGVLTETQQQRKNLLEQRGVQHRARDVAYQKKSPFVGRVKMSTSSKRKLEDAEFAEREKQRKKDERARRDAAGHVAPSRQTVF